MFDPVPIQCAKNVRSLIETCGGGDNTNMNWHSRTRPNEVGSSPLHVVGNARAVGPLNQSAEKFRAETPHKREGGCRRWPEKRTSWG